MNKDTLAKRKSMPLPKRLLIEGFERLGFEVVKRDPQSNINVFRKNRTTLERFDHIKSLIDVGIGTSGTIHLWNAFPDAKLLLIDPLKESEKGVQKAAGRDPIFFQVGVGSETGKKIINIPESPNKSSFYERTALTAKPTKEVREVDVKTLDDLVRESGIPTPYGLKIDTEGAELEVLRSGRETLKQCEFVVMEVRHTKSSFFGGYSLHSLMSEMYYAGFVPSEILNAGETMSDIMFERACEPFGGVI